MNRRDSSRLLGCALVWGAATHLTGCKEDKPYTPFEVTSALPEVPSAPPPASTDEAAPEPSRPFEAPPRRALQAPRDAKTWTLGERTLQAPAGHVFRLALPLDKRDPNEESPGVVVWTMRPASASAPASGTLWLYGPTGPRRLVELPGFVPVSPDCEHHAHLDQTGPRTVTLDVEARCTARLVPRAPTRSLLVVDPLRDEPVLLGFRVAGAAPGETLEPRIDSRDLDGDGRDDVTLRVTVGTDDKQTASAEFVWFDRAAGRSPDVREPASGFRKAAARLATRAKGKKTAASVGQEADVIRRLYAATCVESGTPRVWSLDGAGLSCNAAESLTSLLAAEIDAALTLDRPLDGIGLLERDGWFGPKLSAKEKERLERALLARVRHGQPTRVGSFAANLRPRGTEPRFSPLHFDASGHLWVRTADAQVLLSAPPGAPLQNPSPGAGGAPNELSVPHAWSLRVTSPLGQTWTGTIPSCDRAELQLGFVSREGAALPPHPTALLAPRPGACRGTAAPPPITAVPLAWRGNEIDAWVAGIRTEPAGAPSLGPGTPFSADGRVLVLPSRLGLVVLRDHRPELWHGGEDLRGLTDCVPSKNATQIACVQGSRVVVLARPTSLPSDG